MTLSFQVFEAKAELDRVRSIVCKYAHEYIAEPTLENEHALAAVLQEETRAYQALTALCTGVAS